MDFLHGLSHLRSVAVWLLHRLDRIDRNILVAKKMTRRIRVMLKFMRLTHIRYKIKSP